MLEIYAEVLRKWKLRFATAALRILRPTGKPSKLACQAQSDHADVRSPARAAYRTVNESSPAFGREAAHRSPRRPGRRNNSWPVCAGWELHSSSAGAAESPDRAGCLYCAALVADAHRSGAARPQSQVRVY